MLGLMVIVMGGCSSIDRGAASLGTQATSLSTEAATPAAAANPAASPRFAGAPPADWDGAIVRTDELPAEALKTLALIAAGGPYPYDQDGSTFQNREGILPHRSSGYYREYTVDTPGSPDRGARRLVVGDDTAAYYTDDHYDSFRFVAP